MDIKIKNLQTKIPIHLPRIKNVVRRTFHHSHITDAELSLVFVAPLRMRSLNAKYLKHDYVTDVLTFDYSGVGGQGSGSKKNVRFSSLVLRPSSFVQGEIVICPSVAFSNAKDLGTSVYKEIELYVVHGILHLMGYDDHAPRDIQRMRNKEREIISKL